MLYSGFDILSRSVFWSADSNGRSDNLDVILLRIMTNPATASTQYGDFKGSIAIDGHNGLSIHDLFQTAEIPSGYYPVSVQICGFAQPGIEGQGQPPRLSAYVLCVDTEQTGTGPDDIARYCRENPELHTFRFPATIDFMDLVTRLKRLDIFLHSKLTREAEVRIQPVDD